MALRIDDNLNRVYNIGPVHHGRFRPLSHVEKMDVCLKAIEYGALQGAFLGGCLALLIMHSPSEEIDSHSRLIAIAIGAFLGAAGEAGRRLIKTLTLIEEQELIFNQDLNNFFRVPSPNDDL